MKRIFGILAVVAIGAGCGCGMGPRGRDGFRFEIIRPPIIEVPTVMDFGQTRLRMSAFGEMRQLPQGPEELCWPPYRAPERVGPPKSGGWGSGGSEGEGK